MLLDEIIDLATTDREPVSVLLRKCLILGHRLKNERLIAWANQELKGYDSIDGLPTYRIYSTNAKGHLSGPFGSSVTNLQIPSLLLDEKHQHFATTVYLREPISSYEEMMRSDSEVFRCYWPADLVLLYQKRIRTESGCCLAQAWQDIGKNTLAQVFDAVRNRTLSLALEIRASIHGSDEALDNVSGQTAAAIDHSVTTNIYGGVNVIASGHSNVTSTVNQGSQTISVGNEEQLRDVMRHASLSEESLGALSQAIKQDGGDRIGAKVHSWVKENAPKAIIGGVKVGAQAAQAVLTAYLMQYFGLSH
jgi:hypothetical protein